MTSVSSHLLSQVSEQSAERIRALEVHHAVAEKPKPVASMGGHPISHATKRGFKRGGAGEDAGPLLELVRPGWKQWATKFGSWSRCACLPPSSPRAAWPAPFAPFSSRAAGVGQVPAHVWRSTPPDPLAAFDALASGPRVGTLGVGQKRACWSSPISCTRAPLRLRKLSAAGVCHTATCQPSLLGVSRPSPLMQLSSRCDTGAAPGVCQERIAPVSESIAPPWPPQLSLSSARAVGHISAVRLR